MHHPLCSTIPIEPEKGGMNRIQFDINRQRCFQIVNYLHHMNQSNPPDLENTSSNKRWFHFKRLYFELRWAMGFVFISPDLIDLSEFYCVQCHVGFREI